MKTIAIKGDIREKVGKSANKALRNQGLVPCVVYGGEEADFKNLVYTPNAYLVQLNLGGKKIMAKLHELQFHPVSEAIIHADFMQIYEDRLVKMDIPVQVKGNSPGVRAGGKLVIKMKKLKVGHL